jgi:malate synthase
MADLSIDTCANVDGVEIKGPHSEILSPPAVAFLAGLARKFDGRRLALLEARKLKLAKIRQGEMWDFLPETAAIRSQDWKVAAIPNDLRDRRVEITGPVDRKMVINGLNSGANVYMADFEDSNSPTWQNNVEGQINLRDAVKGTISYVSPEGKHYALAARTATLFVRPRGLHLNEKHFVVDRQPISGSLFDFGLFFFHNAHALIAKGTAPYFYLPKMQSHLEARWWNDVFKFAQDELDIPKGTIRATALIETLMAAFEMDEILYELREHSAGLNCGRWDYIFSFIKAVSDSPDFVFPDRASVTMDKHFLNSYTSLLVKTCHRRGIHAMGGMAAQIPIKNDAQANEKAIEKVKQDKLRELKLGHDGTWVAHPGLVPIAKAVFDELGDQPNQINVMRDDINVTAGDLLEVPQGAITEVGLRLNIDVGIQYLESWLCGSGCVPIYNLMEDAATAEISRTQVWQWVRHQAKTNEGKIVTAELVQAIVDDELQKLKDRMGDVKFDAGKYVLAAKLFEKLSTSSELLEFLTLPAYEYLD